MDLPFTTEQFLDVFRAYNTAIWPAQIGAYLLGLLAVGHVIWKKGASDRLVIRILAIFWLWIGVLYHLIFFSTINQAAVLFGSIFIVQAVLFLVVDGSRRELDIGLGWDAYSIVGAILIVYALVGYLLVGAALDHAYPYAPMFGVAPCPTTIFTFGILLWARRRVPGWLLVIPFLWSLLSAAAALKLGIREDAGLLIAGMVGTPMILYRNWSMTRRRRLAAT